MKLEFNIDVRVHWYIDCKTWLLMMVRTFHHFHALLADAIQQKERRAGYFANEILLRLTL